MFTCQALPKRGREANFAVALQWGSGGTVPACQPHSDFVAQVLRSGSLERVLSVARRRSVSELTVRFDTHGSVLMGAGQVGHRMAIICRASSEEPHQCARRRRAGRDHRRPRQDLGEPNAPLDLDDPLFCTPESSQLVHARRNAHDGPAENRQPVSAVVRTSFEPFMMGPMDGTRMNRTMNAFAAVLGVVAALLMCGPTAGIAQAVVAAPAGDVIALGDPNALGVVDMYVDPMCPFSGQMVQEQGDEIGRRLEDGSLRVNLRFVNFLDKYSASKTYDVRAIYAAFVVADQSRSSGVTWRFVQQIFSAEQQPHEGGSTDLDNNQLAELANRVGAPPPAQDLIRIGLPIGFDAHTIAANNLAALRQFPEPGVPTVVVNGGAPVDGNTAWLDQLPG